MFSPKKLLLSLKPLLTYAKMIQIDHNIVFIKNAIFAENWQKSLKIVEVGRA
jgi:hypothetical protein